MNNNIVMKGLLVLFLFSILLVSNNGEEEEANRCTSASYEGADEIYQQAEDEGIALEQWNCESCNCCDTEDMQNATAVEEGTLCETPQLFWFDPSALSVLSRYHCSAAQRAIMGANFNFDEECNDPTSEYFETGCCCIGCTEPIEVVYPLQADGNADLGAPPSSRTDICQCGPEIRAASFSGSSRMRVLETESIFQERHVGTDVGLSGFFGLLVQIFFDLISAAGLG